MASVFEIRQGWRRAGVTALLVGVAVALFTVATGGLVVLPALGTLDPAAGLALPLGVLVGPAAAVGVALGVGLGATAQGTLSWWTALDAAVLGGLAYLGSQLWGVLPGVGTAAAPSLRSLRQWVEFLAVTVVGGAGAAATLAWGAVLGWGSPFHAVALAELTVLVTSTLLLGPAVLLVGAALPTEAFPSGSQRPTIETRTGAFWGGVVTPLVWLVGATALSLVARIPSIQLFAGAVALAVLVATYRPRPGAETEPSPPANSTEP
jgi:hypothetical protein